MTDPLLQKVANSCCDQCRTVCLQAIEELIGTMVTRGHSGNHWFTIPPAPTTGGGDAVPRQDK